MERKAVHLRIFGRVQGVGFRFFIERLANSYGVDGWVRNLPDGSVEALLIGDEEVLKMMIPEIRQGPPSAFVRELRTQWFPQPPEEVYGFHIRF